MCIGKAEKEGFAKSVCTQPSTQCFEFLTCYLVIELQDREVYSFPIFIIKTPLSLKIGWGGGRLFLPQFFNL